VEREVLSETTMLFPSRPSWFFVNFVFVVFGPNAGTRTGRPDAAS